MVPLATGFKNTALRGEHFWKHNPYDFKFRTEAEYERAAIAFLNANLADIGAEECYDQDGNTIRFHPTTLQFAVMKANGIIRTYFKPMPSANAPNNWPVEKTHTLATDYDFFQDKCA